MSQFRCRLRHRLLFPRPRLVAAIAALTAVESFELLGGSGITADACDPWDLLANALGVGAAWALAEHVRAAGRARPLPGWDLDELRGPRRLVGPGDGRGRRVAVVDGGDDPASVPLTAG